MNTYKVSGFFLLMLLISYLPACNKLDEKVFSQDSPDAFFNSRGDVSAALVGMYRPLQQCCGGYEQAGTFILNSVSDEGNAGIQWGQFDALTYTPNSTGEIGDLWNATYRSISSANFVLDNEAKIEALDNTTDKSFAKASIAEAKFVRALDYFQLVQMFGGVPLRTTQAKRLDDADIARSSEDSVYAQIIADFKDAESNLPATNSVGKPNKWTASSFLAKVYITRKDYVNALAEAKAVVASGVYSLVPKFADIFDVENKNNPEVIFAIQYVRVDQQGMRMEFLVMGPNDHYASGNQAGWGLGYMEDGFRDKYNPLDDRLGTTFTSLVLRPGDQDHFYPGKWKDPAGVTADGHGNNFIVLRYADVVLLLAEAENEVNGPTTDAYAAVNQVRGRANLAGLPGSLSKDQFRDSVINERHLELAYEEIRWFDLKRTGKLKDAMIAAGKTWNDRYTLFPIPQSEVDASNGKIEQNPGY